MLRIGKNAKDPQDDEHTSDKQDAYNTPRNNYPSYQGATDTKPASEQISAKAMTESETLARDIKEGTLSGFVGNGTSVTGEATFKAMLRVDGHLSGRVSSGSSGHPRHDKWRHHCYATAGTRPGGKGERQHTDSFADY